MERPGKVVNGVNWVQVTVAGLANLRGPQDVWMPESVVEDIERGVICYTEDYRGPEPVAIPVAAFDGYIKQVEANSA